MQTTQLRAALCGISVYRAVLDAPPMRAVRALLDALADGRGEDALHAYSAVFAELCAAGHLNLNHALHDALRYTETPWPLALEQSGTAPRLMERAARHEITLLARLANLDCESVVGILQSRLPAEYAQTLTALPRWNAEAEFSFDSLREFYLEHGCGPFARYRAFLWDGSLIPIPDPDCSGSEEMLGYELQRGQVLENTRALLSGKRVNNVLLYGDSGTGKSATVKSLLAAPGCAALRMIEVAAVGLNTLPALMRMLRHRSQRFVLLLDDLTFTRDDPAYAALKSMLEGGLERQPDNVAIYATSNRRHLTRQAFSDRAGDEVDLAESMAESTSLAERFGMRIAYLSLSRAEYLALVERMADLYGVQTDPSLLRAEAIKWEAAHPGRTPRTAKQFIVSLG